jgi:hypothetical protein
VPSDPRLGVRIKAEDLNMNRETVRQIVNEDLGMRKFFAKMVPRILTHDKKRQLHISSDLRIPLQKWTIQPHSPDLAPCDFWLFPKLKSALKGRIFDDFYDVQCNVKTLLRGIPENDFQDCLRQWHHCLTKCIASLGEYFEGDSSC